MNRGALGHLIGCEIPLIVANTYFAQAAFECYLAYSRNMYISCVMTSHAVGEGITKYILATNSIETNIQRPKLFYHMMDYGMVTPDYALAATELYKSYRNDYHHMNIAIGKLDHKELATINLRRLAVLEREVFGGYFDKNGHLVMLQPKYWEVNGRTVDGYIREEFSA